MSGMKMQALPAARVVDEYFVESRNRLIELAAFLDRVDRADDAAGDPDFRMEALRNAVDVLTQAGPGRVEKILLMWSDPTETPLERLDRKGALGAYRAQGTV